MAGVRRASVWAALGGVAVLAASLIPVSSAGAQAESEPVTVGTTPGRPSSLSAVPGNKMVTLSWTASSDGGFAITSWQFRLTTDDGTFTETAPAWVAIPGSGADTTTHSVVSLENDRRYKFQVRAVNARGAGTAAESAVADPGTPPGAPTGLSGAATQDFPSPERGPRRSTRLAQRSTMVATRSCAMSTR